MDRLQRRRVWGAATLAVSLALGSSSLAADGPRQVATTGHQDVTKWIRRYLSLPSEKRGNQFFEGFAPERADEAPPVLRLLAADYYLRNRRPRVASRLFTDVMENSPDPQLTSLAEFGIAWAALGAGDLALAQVLFKDGSLQPSFATPLVTIVLAMLDGSAGDTARALALLDGAPVGQGSSPEARATTALARGYIQYWAGDLAAATGTFAAVAASGASGTLEDDARYGAAWSRYRAGDERAALDDLRELAGRAPEPAASCHVGFALINLEARAVLQDSFRRYRAGGVRLPDAQLRGLLDGDGVTRACAALRMIAPADRSTAVDGRPARAESEMAPVGQRPAAAAASMPSPLAHAPSAEPAADGRHVARSTSVAGSLIVALLMLLVVVVAIRVVGGRRTTTLSRD